MQKIWQFKDNEAVETDSVDLKTFKPVGKFYEDVETLAKIFNIKVHPALKPANYSGSEDHPSQANEEQKHHDLNTLNFYKHRVDRNTLK